jgi:hypothetical protein
MLEFNPNKRISTEAALKCSYFDDVRILAQEEFEICDIKLDFDEVELSPEEIKKLIVEEMKSSTVNLNTIM